jgi:hypothetical protein
VSAVETLKRLNRAPAMRPTFFKSQASSKNILQKHS